NNASDLFGYSVALSGDTLAVGAHAEDSNQTTITNGTGSSADNSLSNSGAVYIYTSNLRLFDPSDVWMPAHTTSSIDLAWASSGAMTTGYKIAYAEGTTPPADCNSGTVIDAGNVTTYSVTGLSPGKHYSFRICSYDSLANLSQGYTTRFQTAPATPEVTDLLAVSNESWSVDLSWTSGGGATTG
ncbi:MAG: fibronectin type III domain-containing protein, partial [Bacteriovoracia bacterium]